MRVQDLLSMLAEMLGITRAIEFVDGEHPGHYVRTPYAYQPKLGRKYMPPLHVDLGQGLLQLIDEVRASGIDFREDQATSKKLSRGANT